MVAAAAAITSLEQPGMVSVLSAKCLPTYPGDHGKGNSFIYHSNRIVSSINEKLMRNGSAKAKMRDYFRSEMWRNKRTT